MPDEYVVIDLPGPEESRALAMTIGNLYRAVFSLPPFLELKTSSAASDLTTRTC
jgi:hypothetical protein